MQRIPEEVIQQVLTATNIVDVIGRVVTLKRAGTNYSGLCPFHTEKSPSFSVSPSKGMYHCFGCKAGGTAIKFLQEHEGITFTEAVKRLADAAGIRIEEQVWDANAEKEAKHRAALRRVHADITEWFHSLLLRHPMADAARQYLKGRGLNSTIAKNWQLGYAPEQGMWMRRWAAEHKYSEQLMVDAGLFKRSDRGETYPYFRHRLMFPIRNENGDVIAFSGRQLSAEAKGGKYVNSPETVLFSKSKVLFGFDKSRKAISKLGRAIVCEGQLDMVTVFESGVENVVATQGTAFTEHHAKMLKRSCEEVVLCFDADNAGYMAAEKTFKILSPVGLTVKVARLPKGEDPDSLIRAQGPEAFRKVVDAAVDFLDFQISHQKASAGSDLTSQVQLIEKTAVTIAMSPSVAARDLMIRSHASQLGISEDALRKEVNIFLRRQAKGEAQQPTKSSPVDEARKLLALQHPTSLLLCGMALNNQGVLDWVRSIDLEPVLHDLPGTALLARIWHSSFAANDGPSQAAFFSTLPEDEQTAFAQLQAQAMPRGTVDDAQAAWSSLDLARLDHLIRQTQARMTDPALEPSQLGEMHARVMTWRKEYLDRTTPSQDTRPPP